jgi:hypothetical protein
VIPSQLPADVAGFVGRADDLRQLDALLPERGARAETALGVAVVAGMAGVGKTALAVHWAHRVADQFPDGQLYLDLHGYAATPPMRPIEALRQLLHGLGVDQVPADLEEAAGLYRSVTAGRRLLLLLANAATADQVRSLLPVTSRDRLAGLVATHGARRLVPGPLHPEEAKALLGEVVGAKRVEAEPEASAELARSCAHLPLALRIAAANLADDPQQPISGQVATLRVGDRLAALEIEGDPDAAVRAAFGASYQRLAAPEGQLFRLLGLVPGPHFTAAAAAASSDPAPATPASPLPGWPPPTWSTSTSRDATACTTCCACTPPNELRRSTPGSGRRPRGGCWSCTCSAPTRPPGCCIPKSCGSPRPATPARRGGRRSPDGPRPWNGWTWKPPTCWRPSATPPTTDHVRWPSSSPTPSVATSGCGSPPPPGRTSPAPPGRPQWPRATCTRRSRRP